MNDHERTSKMTPDEEHAVVEALGKIHRAITRLAYKLGPEHAVAIAAARGWDLMRAGIRSELAVEDEPIEDDA